jgi:hypothetical protein
MKHIIIIGSIDLGSTVAKAIHNNIDQAVVVVNNLEAKNIVNSQFKPEPIIFEMRTVQLPETKIIDTPKNKFFDKPKNNFKK